MFFSNFTQDAEKLVQASDDGSSSAPSSLRTQKSLHRQREWEIDHARVRAQKLREERLKEFQQEEKVGLEATADFLAQGSLYSSSFLFWVSFATPCQHVRRSRARQKVSRLPNKA